MDNLLTPEEIQNKVNKYVIEMITYPIESFDELVGTVMLHFGLSYEVASSVTFNALRAQAYKEKIEKLAEPEKLREAIAKEICDKDDEFGECSMNWDEAIKSEDSGCKKYYLHTANRVLSLLTPYTNQAKQEERERIAKYMSLKDTCPHNPNDDCDVDCEKCWQEALKDGK